MQRIVIVGTDDQNVFSWMRKGNARVGRSRRILTAFPIWCIHRGIEVIPFYLRSHHNSSADLITRANAEGLSAWEARQEMARAKLPWWRETFCRYGNVIKWSSALVSAIPRVPSPIAGTNVTVVEWNGSNFPGAWISRQYGCQLFCLHPRWHDSSPKQCNLPWRKTGSPDILIGAAKSSKECTNFIEITKEWTPWVAYLVTPSEISPIGKEVGIWPHHLWFDSSTIGDGMGEIWNLFVASKHPVGSIKNGAMGSTADNISGLYRYHGRHVLPDESLDLQTAVIPNSVARRITYKDSKGR